MKRLASILALLLATPAGAVILSGGGGGTTWPTYDGGGGGIITIVNQRYYADANGNPKFLLGYYSWTTGELDVPMSADRTITGRQMIEDSMSPNGLNYLRFSNGLIRASSKTTPRSYDGTPNLVPFLYEGSPAKADLDQWDSAYWTAAKQLIELAQSRGIIVHVSFFDGACSMQPRASWRDSWWNIDNQKVNYYGDLDLDRNNHVDADGEFYRLSDFNDNTGVGYYQRRLIAKIIEEFDQYNNVMYEVGNETYGAPANWLEAVITYARTLTIRPVTINLTTGQTKPTVVYGYTNHDGANGDTPAQVKAWTAGHTGAGYPAFIDPDGPDLGECTGATAYLCRQAAWYSLTEGGAGFGGFFIWQTVYNDNVPLFYGYLNNFLTDTAARFWEMVPRSDKISNATSNSMIANPGYEYLGYVLSDATIDVTLDNGTYTAKYIDVVSGAIMTGSDVDGSGTRTLSKPGGASDWAFYLKCIAGTGCGQVDYTTTDDFNRGDVNPIVSPWAAVTGGTPIQIVSGMATGTTSRSNNMAYRTDMPIAGDQWGQITKSNTGTVGLGVLLRIDKNSPQKKGYDLRCEPAVINLWRDDAGSSVLLDSEATTCLDTDTIKLSAIGDVIKAYKNDVEIMSVVDNTYPTGVFGLLFRGATIFGDNAEWGWEATPSTDTSPPYLSSHNPHQQTGVADSTDHASFHVRDDGVDVDNATIRVQHVPGKFHPVSRHTIR